MTRRAQPDFTDEFKREAVRLTEASVRTVREIADDLGIGKSTLARWKHKHREADLMAGPHDDVRGRDGRYRLNGSPLIPGKSKATSLGGRCGRFRLGSRSTAPPYPMTETAMRLEVR